MVDDSSQFLISRRIAVKHSDIPDKVVAAAPPVDLPLREILISREPLLTGTQAVPSRT